MGKIARLALAFLALVQVSARAAEVGQWEVFETSFASAKRYDNPFLELEVDIVFRKGEQQWKVPAFWAGDDKWTVRFAPPEPGAYTFVAQCSDPANEALNGNQQSLTVRAYAGDNPLLTHGFLRVSRNGRHFEHADGTPFFWLGDTWWKGLSKRLTWEGFQQLTANRHAKGFTVVQIVCGPYPDEGHFQELWKNEAGFPYTAAGFERVNPAYFDFADRRFRHLVESGIVPAIVGGWGRGDCDGMALGGFDGMKRHWRYLVARYGAYPTVWIIGGESGGPQWTELARYVRQIDPYNRPTTMHPFDSGRSRVTDETVINFDMLQTGHGDWDAARGAIPKLIAAHARNPVMPVMIGEYCYEGHMQTAFQDVQRYVFWASMLSGSAGLTYGAAGVWHASIDGDPGLVPGREYDWTTWKEGMNFPGSAQLGLGKQLLEKYPWWRFESHPEWVAAGGFAAGIPGQLRVMYLPRNGIYNWTGPVLRQLERDVPYRGFYFDPASGRRFDLGTLVRSDPSPKMWEHSKPPLVNDRFENADASAWKDYGTPTRRENGFLVGGKGLVTVVEEVNDADLIASVDANSDAEAGVILRFHDADNYLVALYSPLEKAVFLHNRKDGNWGMALGKLPVPKLGPKIQLALAASGAYVVFSLTDGEHSYQSPYLKVDNTTPGKAGVWLYQIGDRQEFDNFQLSKTQFVPTADHVLTSDDCVGPNVPSPQDWVLVLERTPQTQ